jgi:hypothetical protein
VGKGGEEGVLARIHCCCVAYFRVLLIQTCGSSGMIYTIMDFRYLQCILLVYMILNECTLCVCVCGRNSLKHRRDEKCTQS